jgi:sugar phosphate isomerase/epimerase
MLNSREFVKAKLECIRKREAGVENYFRRAKETLRRVADYAAEKGVRLGVESRHSFEEIQMSGKCSKYWMSLTNPLSAIGTISGMCR